MDAWQPLDRRTFLADMGRGAFALAVLGVAACGPGATATGQPPETPAGSRGPSGTSPSRDAGAASGAPPSGPPGSPAAGEVTWARVNLGFVSAYILVRGGEAVIVDTGVADSADAIEGSLGAAGLDWSNVGHLILTHHHGDHVGSAAAVMDRSSDATGYAGAEDIPAITVPRPLTAVGDGDEV